MSSQAHREPVVIAEYPTEVQAALAAAALRDAGIRCEMVGAASAGFRAEAPGYVRLYVPHADAARARDVLERFEAQARNDEQDPNPPDDQDDPA